MKWSDLLSRALPHLPGCPEPLVEQELRAAAIKFCRDTHVWEERLTDVYLVDGIDLYELAVPEESEVVALVYAKQGDETLCPDINVFGHMRFETVPSPDKGPVSVKVRLQPSRDAEGMPDRIGLDYDEAIVSGAIAKLAAMPKKDWTALELVAHHGAKYLEGVAEARVRKARGNTERPLRVTPHPFY